MRWFDGLSALAISALATLLVAQPAVRALEGPALDGLFALRHALYGQRHLRQASPTVIIGVDRETQLRPPFDRLPFELWTPQVAEVMAAVREGGAAVMAQYHGFTASGEAAAPGYDTVYTGFLREAGQASQLVLGRRAPGPDRLSPLPAHIAAVGGYRHVRLAELQPDSDGVVRRIALYHELPTPSGITRLEPSLPLELAARALNERPELVAGSDIRLADRSVPGSAANAMILNPDSGNGGIPVYSFADLHACAGQGERDFFEERFRGKVVLLGRVEAPAGRHLTSARYLDAGSSGALSPGRCQLPAMRSLEALEGPPGTADVVVAATAVNNLLRGEAINSLVAPFGIVVAALLSLAVAVAALRIRIWIVLPAVVLFAVLWIYAAAAMLDREAWLMPLVQPLLAVGVSFLLALLYRFAPRRRRRVAPG
ncbi:CHASE2 domain-containing protein [Pelagibius sp.]|uniref:CHASE2 domain-containing protein n=1 Tax=Pelagibius sp. TaxID=1931238 RepID=UPI00260FE292|nr:CHASE2 domain-containing protein [Pelagibius sp.]